MSIALAMRERQRSLPRMDGGAVVADDDLIHCIARGDEDAVAVLHERYAATMYALVLGIVRHAEVAEEIVQESFLRVWCGAPGFKGQESSGRAWLFRIARNLALDHLRRQTARPRIVTMTPDADDACGLLDTIADGRCDVAVQAINRCMCEWVRHAMMTLPPEQSHALELAYFAGLTHREIARCTGEPLGTIKTRLRLGLQKLGGITGEEPFAASSNRSMGDGVWMVCAD